MNKIASCPSNPSQSCLVTLGDPALNMCVSYSCHSNCDTCFDDTETGCISCPTGSYLKDGACIRGKSYETFK